MKLFNKFEKSNRFTLPSLLFAAFVSLICMTNIWAENLPEIDIYKTNQLSLEDIKERFKNEFKTISDTMNSEDYISSKNSMELVLNSRSKVEAGINKMGEFSYVGISPITYPNDKVLHITIDVVDKSDEKRLHYFTKNPKQNIHDPDNLINKWKEYEHTAFSIVSGQKRFPNFKSCPAYHCSFGFEDSALKKYQNTFTTLVPKNKKILIAILKNDKDQSKRSAAAYLLAHIKDRDELINVLIPSIYDPSDIVRNSVMRVLGATLMKGKISDNFPINSVIQALDFPMTTDRNKALWIIKDLSVKPIYAQYIAKHAGQTLIDILQLSQPNVHELSYSILKQISGKNYGERDYASWQNWLRESQG